MNSVGVGMYTALIGVLMVQAGEGPPEAIPAPTYNILLGGRTACVTPNQLCQARADGGAIDVVAGAGTLSAFLTGTVAANAHLGTTGSACETFHLVQEFEITCSDPTVKTVSLTLESSLVGFVRSRHKAGAQMKLASAVVAPVSRDGMSPLSVDHPMQAVEGTQAQLCNQHLLPLTVERMPVGRYVLKAEFAIDAVAGGLCDGHSVSDFSPSTTLPADWVRTRDPFQGVDKKNFGFFLILTAAVDGPTAAKPTASARTSSPEVIKASAPRMTRRKETAPRPIPPDAKGFERILRH
jgi:hypothetical protein